MKVLILGGDGMLAYALRQVFSFEKVIALNHKACDIINPHQVERHIEALRPDVVLNCAAYTDVEKAETEPNLCELVNAIAVEAMAQVCRRTDSILVQFSSEMVFGQESEEPYDESTEPVSPVNVYGASKLKAERYVQQTWDKHYIIRTSWMFGPNGNNFIDKLIMRASMDASVDVVNDQEGCPTYTFDLARAVYELLADTAPFGVYHLVNQGATTRANFAWEIFDHTNIGCKVNQVPSSSVISLARRPKNGVLLNTKRKSLPRWTDAMVEYLIGKGIIAAF
jgi:dTDP-4-dehydrorhamnose reductase